MNDYKMIPYFAHEGIVSSMERTIKRLWILLIIMLVLLVGSNMAWVYYESQFAEMEVTQDLDAEDGNAIIFDGVHINGDNKTNSQSTSQKDRR